MTAEQIEPWVCDECGSAMVVRRDSEFGPVTIWRCECWLCGHQVRVSVERIVQMDDTNNASWG